MVIAGISTVLVNGNPLLRFDGYYILADLIEIPNLGSRANRYWADIVNRHIFRTHGMQPFEETPGEKRWRSEEHTSELQSLMRISYAVFCLKKKTKYRTQHI